MPSVYRDALAAVRRDTARAFILAALGDADGHVGHAASALGISRAALYNQMHAFGITREDALRLSMPPVELATS